MLSHTSIKELNPGSHIGNLGKQTQEMKDNRDDKDYSEYLISSIK